MNKQKNVTVQIGEALWGPRWQTEMANALGISDRHIRRMVSGEYPLKPGMAIDLWRIAEEHILDIEDILPIIKNLANKKHE